MMEGRGQRKRDRGQRTKDKGGGRRTEYRGLNTEERGKNRQWKSRVVHRVTDRAILAPGAAPAIEAAPRLLLSSSPPLLLS